MCADRQAGASGGARLANVVLAGGNRAARPTRVTETIANARLRHEGWCVRAQYAGKSA
jgi:hypothetical protein